MMNLKKSELFILIGLLSLGFVPFIGGTFRLLELGVGLELFLPENPRIHSVPVPAVFHIISAVIYTIIGAFQFIPSIRRSHPKWHRLTGRLLVGAGVVSAITGLWMTHYYSFPDSLQGVLLYFVRILVGFSMIVFILLGLSAILEKRIAQHRAWMIRAYALGIGAGTQGFVIVPWLLTIGEPSGLARDILMTVAWIINVVVGEWVINKQNNNNPVANYRTGLEA